MSKRRPPGLMIQTPEMPKAPYSLSNSGTFTEGDLMISKAGLVIAETPGSRPNSSRSSNRSDGGSRQSSSRVHTAGSEQDGTGASTRGEDGVFDVLLEDLKNMGVIGNGSSGVVHKVQHLPTGNMLAVKVIQMDIQEQVRKQILMELRTMYAASCKQIVQYHGAFFDKGQFSIVLEYMDGGSLSDVVRKNTKIPELYLSLITRQVLDGLIYLHKDLRIIHRDIKPSNLLLNSQGEVKISDFGVSGQLANSVSKCASWVGTVTYMSPERISGKKYSWDSDLWSMGLSLLECAMGRFPYPPPDPQGATQSLGFWDLLDFIVEEPPPSLPQGEFSDEFRDFVDKCLSKDPTLRPKAEDLLDHPFVKRADQCVGMSVADLLKGGQLAAAGAGVGAAAAAVGGAIKT